MIQSYTHMKKCLRILENVEMNMNMILFLAFRCAPLCRDTNTGEKIERERIIVENLLFWYSYESVSIIVVVIKTLHNNDAQVGKRRESERWKEWWERFFLRIFFLFFLFFVRISHLQFNSILLHKFCGKLKYVSKKAKTVKESMKLYWSDDFVGLIRNR